VVSLGETSFPQSDFADYLTKQNLNHQLLREGEAVPFNKIRLLI
jgi:hypothetical protein